MNTGNPNGNLKDRLQALNQMLMQVQKEEEVLLKQISSQNNGL